MSGPRGGRAEPLYSCAMPQAGPSGMRQGRRGHGEALVTHHTLTLNSVSWPFPHHHKQEIIYFYGTVALKGGTAQCQNQELREAWGPPAYLCPFTVQVGKFYVEDVLGLRVQRSLMLGFSSKPLDFHCQSPPELPNLCHCPAPKPLPDFRVLLPQQPTSKYQNVYFVFYC